MAKVEMNLSEYEELVSYKRAFEDMMQVNISEWDIDYFRRNVIYNLPLQSRILENLHPATQELLKKYFFNSIPEDVKDLGNIELSNFQMTFGYLAHFPEPEEGGEDNA